MKNFFCSLKTTVWTILALICLFFLGSFLMPAHREIFFSMNDDILFRWIADAAAKNIQYTWWFVAALAALALLTVNTVACSLQAIRSKWSTKDFLLRISPQVIHIGFLFILLAHLLSAGWGYKVSGIMPEGAYAPLPEDRALLLKEIRVKTDARGYMSDWAAEASVFENNQLVETGALGPNTPLFYRGMGVYLKSLNFDRGPAALLIIAKDPGAVLALVGGIVFTLGSIMVVLLKWKRS